jgi:hypothetical protein
MANGGERRRLLLREAVAIHALAKAVADAVQALHGRKRCAVLLELLAVGEVAVAVA